MSKLSILLRKLIYWCMRLLKLAGTCDTVCECFRYFNRTTVSVIREP
jgi:hypothetical protein